MLKSIHGYLLNFTLAYQFNYIIIFGNSFIVLTFQFNYVTCSKST